MAEAPLQGMVVPIGYSMVGLGKRSPGPRQPTTCSSRWSATDGEPAARCLMRNRRLGGMVTIEIMTVVVSMFVQRAWHLSLHGGASEESCRGNVVDGTLVIGTERIRVAWRRRGMNGGAQNPRGIF
jgi:hypothetical protein